MKPALFRMGMLSAGALACCCVVACTTTASDIFRESPAKGFTKEIDEPTNRGPLKKVSPENINGRGRFSLSPDENRIVFSGYQGEQKSALHLWRISSDGGAPTKLTSGGNGDYESPSYTADGEHIVFENQGQIWRLRSDGTGGRQKIPGSGTRSDQSPHVSQEDKLVFSSLEGTTYFIWTSDLDGRDLTQLREGRNPRWSPDGARIAFEHEGDIWIMNSNGTETIQLTSTPDSREGLPAFSPSGEHLAYVSDEGTDSSADVNIWTMKIDGSEVSQITELSSWDSWPVWTNIGIYFLSGRASSSRNMQRIWLLQSREASVEEGFRTPARDGVRISSTEPERMS